MIILLASDNRFVQHCAVTMASVMENNTNVTFYLLTQGLTDSNVMLLKELARKYHCELQVCVIDDKLTSTFPMPKDGGEHISIATYYRLFVEMVLPTEVDRVIYMDCDIVVRGSLESLWNENLDGYALGVVYQGMNFLQDRDFDRLGIPKEKGYFNAGVLLMNLDYWRKYDVTKRLFDFIKYNFKCIKQHDQDTLNSILYNEVKPISYIWNYLPQFFLVEREELTFPAHVDYKKIIEPIVIHYVSVPKPWDWGCYNPYTKEYYKYLKKTPFAAYRPKFVLKKYIKQRGWPLIIHFVIKLDVLKIRRLFK